MNLCCSKIRSVITYAGPAWMTFLSEHQILRLVKVEKTAMRIIFPNNDHVEALQMANIPHLRDFCGKLIQTTFLRVLRNPGHFLHDKLPDPSKRLARSNSGYGLKHFIHEKCNTVKRANSFIPWCIRKHDGNEPWHL